MFNISICLTLEQDFSDTSRLISSNRLTLLAISVASGVIDVFIFISNAILVAALIKSSYRTEGKVTMTSSNISQRSRLLMASVSLCHTVVGGFLIPAAITQMINNGMWVLGPYLCTAKNVVEAVTAAICMYHVIFMSLDMYLAICWPLIHRRLTSKSSYLMISSSWALPMGIFVIPMLFEWHQKGKELIIMCQNVYDICSSVFNDYFLYAITLILAILPFFALVTMYVLILKAISMFHSRLPTDTIRTFKRNVSITDATSHICATVQSEMSEGNTEISNIAFGSKKDSAISQANIEDSREAISRVCTSESKDGLDGNSAINKIKKMHHGKEKITSREVRSNFSNFRKSCRNARAFRYILCVITWYGILWITFFIFKMITMYRPDLTPKWLMTAMWWLGYLNSAANPFLLCSNNNVRHCVETLIGFRFLRD